MYKLRTYVYKPHPPPVVQKRNTCSLVLVYIDRNPFYTKDIGARDRRKHSANSGGCRTSIWKTLWENRWETLLKKCFPNIVDKNVATVLQNYLSLDSIIYLNHLKLIKYGSIYRFFPLLTIFCLIDLLLFNMLLELIFLN